MSNFFFFFNDTATTEIYTFPYTTLFRSRGERAGVRSWCSARYAARSRSLAGQAGLMTVFATTSRALDRKSTRLNSSHSQISYAVFCLKKKNNFAAYKKRLHVRHIARVLS